MSSNNNSSPTGTFVNSIQQGSITTGQEGSLDRRRQTGSRITPSELKKLDKEIVVKILAWSFGTWCVLGLLALIMDMVIFCSTSETPDFLGDVKDMSSVVVSIITMCVGYIVGSKQ